jgi:hypothetical protein
VCLARPELLDARLGWSGGKLNATSILLEPLSAAQSGELIENLAGGTVEPPTRQRIVEAAEGNPLFVEEMLALTLENRGTGAELAVPATIQALLAARLDRLADEERIVIEHAAVVGKVFYEDAVADLAPPALRAGVQAALAALLHKDLIRPDRPGFGGRTYRFRHLLIRDAAYEAIPKEVRVELHQRFARWLEQAAGERAIEYQAIAGYHLEQAYRYLVEFGKPDEAARAVGREAAVRLGAAGRRAFVRNDTPAAVNLVSRAVSLLQADDPLRVELIPNVRAMQGIGDDLTWADRALTEAVEAAATIGDRRAAAHALVQRGFLRLFTEVDISSAELFGAAERALAVFEELGDHLGMARAWRLVAQAHYLDRRGGESEDASEKALAHVLKVGDRFEETEIVTWLAVVLALGPAPAARAVGRCEQLLDEIAGNAVLEVVLLSIMGYLEAIQDRLHEAREFFDQGQARMDELGEGGLDLLALRPDGRSRLGRARAAPGDGAARQDRREEPLLVDCRGVGACELRTGEVRRCGDVDPGGGGGVATERHPRPDHVAVGSRESTRATGGAPGCGGARPGGDRVRREQRLREQPRARAGGFRRDPRAGGARRGGGRLVARGDRALRPEGEPAHRLEHARRPREAGASDLPLAGARRCEGLGVRAGVGLDPEREAAEGRVRERVVEDVEGVLGVCVELEPSIGARIGDRHLEPVVYASPEERHGDAVAGPPGQLRVCRAALHRSAPFCCANETGGR